MHQRKNKYYKRSHISEGKFRHLLKCFSLDLNAFEAHKITNISHRSCKLIYGKLRSHIVQLFTHSTPTVGEFECDESYFGPRRVRGKRGRGALGKTPVLGILKRGGRVYVSIVKNCSQAALLPVIQGKILEGSTIHTDGWKAYDGLILNSYDHYRVYHSHNEFSRGKSHINGLESFWSFAKRRLSQFNGVSPKTFYLFIKETEFRFNHRDQNLYQLLLRKLRKYPL